MSKPDLTEADEADLVRSIKTHFPARAAALLSTDAGRASLAEHIHGRLKHLRATIIPWLLSAVDLYRYNVLEVGAGTGASTVALAEVSRSIHAIDVDACSIAVAKDRLRLHEVTNVTLAVMNATDVDCLAPQQFDLIVFYAALEHMTYEERLRSLSAAAQRVHAGGYIAVIDTPNRLWLHDSHTSLLPFFHWLPDELAILYASRSGRLEFRDDFAVPGPDDRTRLARWGRGVSYHEFELALGLENLEAVSSYQGFQRTNEPGAQEWWDRSDEGRYQALLRAAAPHVPLIFLENALNFIVRKR